MNRTSRSAPKIRRRRPVAVSVNELTSADGRGERFATEDLLLRDHAFGAHAGEEGDRPGGEPQNAVLEPGQPDEVDGEPEQPRGKAGDAQPADAADRAEA